MNGDYLGDANAGRTGKVFSVRLTEHQRAQLTTKMRAAYAELPYDPTRRRGSLGHYIVWAALRFEPRQMDLYRPSEAKPDGRATDGTVYRKGKVVARRVNGRRPGQLVSGVIPKVAAKRKARR
jgi:hypothetical protein